MRGWMEIRQSNPLFFFFYLYPPLTPVPQCEAEIRAIGQSPIHCHPEYFKVKPLRLTKKSYSSKVYFPFFPSPPSAPRPKDLPWFLHAPFSLWSAVLSSHLRGREGREVVGFGSSPSFHFQFNELWFGV